MSASQGSDRALGSTVPAALATVPTPTPKSPGGLAPGSPLVGCWGRRQDGPNGGGGGLLYHQPFHAPPPQPHSQKLPFPSPEIKCFFPFTLTAAPSAQQIAAGPRAGLPHEVPGGESQPRSLAPSDEAGNWDKRQGVGG